MTIHYHGTPITPQAELLRLAGRHFCVSFATPYQVKTVHDIGQSVMLDNGAYTHWRQGREGYGHIGDTERQWRATITTETYSKYVDWAREWTAHKTTWCVIPDSIVGDAELNQRLVDEWPINEIGVTQAAPVWHLHEPIDRLLNLVNITPYWQRVCIGSSGEYAQVGTARWHRRMDTLFNRLSSDTGRIPVWLHMLRGISLLGSYYPFASVDSCHVGRNFKETGDIVAMVDKIDARQLQPYWMPKMEQVDML